MNESTNDGLVMIEIPCEECINGSVERAVATMPVACLHCDGTGRVELYGDDATDELERREVAKRKAEIAADVVLAFTLTGDERRVFERERPVKSERVRIAGRRADGVGGEIIGRAEMSRALGERLVARLNKEYPEYVRRVVPVAAPSAVALLAAEGRSGSLARPVIAQGDAPGKPGRNAWPFDNALEASRDKRARRTNAHPATVAAFAYFQANPAAGFEKRVGGWAR